MRFGNSSTKKLILILSIPLILLSIIFFRDRVTLSSEIIIATTNNNCFVDQVLPFVKESNTWTGLVGQNMQVQGWYVSDSAEPPTDVYATLSLKTDPSVNYLLKGISSQNRVDVGTYFGNEKFSLSGFDLKSESEIITSGQYLLTLIGKIGQATTTCLVRDDFIFKN